MRIVVPDDFPPVYQGHAELEALKSHGEVVVYDTKAANGLELAERLKGAEATINVRAYSRFDRSLLEMLPDLRTIAILGTGTDNVDLEAATELGIVVSNTPGASTVSVAELAIALMFAASRHVASADRAIRGGQWKHVQGMELRGKTVGLVGLGAIGQEVASIALALGMRTVGWSLTRDEDRARIAGVELMDFDDLLRVSDVVSLHLRASDRTRGIIGARELGLMKATAVLVNTARGALVDEAALAEALGSGQIAAAGLDAFIQEPLPPESPLARLDNVVLNPHHGWVTAEAAERLRKMPVDNLIAFFQGRPTNVVNPGSVGKK